jgi:predicted DNA-binding antitoxin AbrB/MazE fold protein
MAANLGNVEWSSGRGTSTAANTVIVIQPFRAMALGRDPRKAAGRIMIVRLLEAQYENGFLRPVEHLGLRSGERVNLLVMRRPDPRRWNLARLESASSQEEVTLSEEGLADWASSLDATPELR